MTSLLVVAAFVIGAILGRRHKPALPLARSRVKFIEKLSRAPDFGATEYEFFWREREE